MSSAEAAAGPRVCASCGTQLATALQVCPACGALVHAETLKRLAAEAERAERDGDPRKALVGWREALEWLPPDSIQSRRISDKVAALSR